MKLSKRMVRVAGAGAVGGTLVAAAAAVGGAPSGAGMGAAPGDDEKKGQPRLLVETGRLVPGETAHLAVTFEIAPGWHMYSPTQNETGGPPSFEFTLPDGFKLAEPAGIWPAPQRYVLDYGDMKILDHIYEDELTVIFPIEVPADAQPGSTAEFAATMSWVICSDSCIFESDSVTLRAPVVAEGEDGARSAIDAEDAAVFERARKRHAQPLLNAGAGEGAANPPVTVSVSDGYVVFGAMEDAVKWMAFYPAEDGLPLANLAETGETKGTTLKIPIGSARPGAASTDSDDAYTRIRGVLEIRTNPDQPGRLWQIDEPSGTL